MIICFIVPETWHMTDVIIFHFGLFFVLLPPLQPPKNENFKKMKKMPEDIVLHKCTKNHDYMLYCSWDMAHDGCNCCFSFWAIFYPFTPLTAWKIRISKKWEIKMPEGIIVLHNCTKNYDYWLYCSWDMVRDGCNCYFSFWAIFYPFTP